MIKFDMGVPPHATFGKNRLRGYTPLGKIYTKNYQFWRFWRRNREVRREATDLGHPSPRLIL